jgi:general secretion pathway protein C
MNTLFKKHFWVLKLAGLALLAFVVSGVVSDVIAGQLFVLPSERLAESRAKGDAAQPASRPGESAEDPTSLGRVTSSVNAATDLTTRRPFHLEDPPPPPAPEPEKVEEAPAPETVSDTLEESKLPINLIGTFVASVPDYSYATLQISGENKIASQGSEYLEGKARVVKIAAGHIVLKEDSRYTYIQVWKKTADAGAKPADVTQIPGYIGPPKNPPPNPTPGSPAPPTPPAEPAAGGDSGGDIAQGVTKTGAYDYSIDRKMLDNQLKDLSKLQQEARPVPHYKDNQYQGFKLVGVRPGGLYRAIGIRSGDVITAVNGNKIDSPNKALELFEQLKSSSNISLEIERRGQPKTLNYTIQ